MTAIQLRIVVGLLSLLGVVRAGADDPFFIGLGHLPGDIESSQSYAISADGSAVVGRVASGFRPEIRSEAFRWTVQTGMVGLGFLPAETPFSVANGVSADGRVVVGKSRILTGQGNSVAFHWTEEAGMVSLGSLPGGLPYSEAGGISNDGSVIVGETSSESVFPNPEAFRWSVDQGMVGLGDLPGGPFMSSALGVSGDGNVIVGASDSALGREAFRWTAELGMTALGALPGGIVLAVAVRTSTDGTVIVGASSSKNSGEFGVEAFRWTDGEMIALGDLPGGRFYSIAIDVCGDGSVIVGLGVTGPDVFDREAFIWDADYGMRNLRFVLVNDLGLDLTGWTLSRANGISRDGRTIVGEGINPDGNPEAWLAHLGSPCDPCDMNCDGDVNTLDIETFLELLFGGGEPCGGCTGDVNGDGNIDALDIEPFLACLFP